MKSGVVLRKNVVNRSFCNPGSKSGLSGDGDFKVSFMGGAGWQVVVTGRESKDWDCHCPIFFLKILV